MSCQRGANGETEGPGRAPGVVLVLLVLAVISCRQAEKNPPAIEPLRHFSGASPEVDEVDLLQPVRLTAEDLPAATFRFTLADDEGKLIPGRLTFVGDSGPGASLFEVTDGAPKELAVRKNVVYSLTGEGAITVPPGTYRIYASRGIEWSLAERRLDLVAGEVAQWDAVLRHEVDTRGWISGDFHLHTLTHSGHGDSNLEERIISFVGEGVEFAVATDHNHNTDYGPVIDDLKAAEHLTAVTGNEVSTPIGHFNAFPLDPKRPVVDPDLADANRLFALLRAETNEFRTVPVIQVNHPRWGNIDYFGLAGLDPVTGVPHRETYSADFDSIEIFNENEGWGYFNAELEELDTGSSEHSVLEDWYHLLNRGYRYAAVGNSDSHTVHAAFAGYPRNFVESAVEDPDRIDPVEIAAAIRSKRVFTTIGPFVEFSIDGVPMGGELETREKTVDLQLKIQAASWIDCDRAKIVVNGDLFEIVLVPEARDVVRLETSRKIPLRGDSWIAVLVEGDDSMSPILHESKRGLFPLAVTNPVWIDADGVPGFTALVEQAEKRLERVSSESWGAFLSSLDDEAPALIAALVAQVSESFPWRVELIRFGLTHEVRKVRLNACRAAEVSRDPRLLESLEEAWRREGQDAFSKVCLLRAFRACGETGLGQRLLSLIEDRDDGGLGTGFDRSELEFLQGEGRMVRDWEVVGYFPNPERTTLVDGVYGPETGLEPSEGFEGKAGARVTWQPRQATANGTLDLGSLDGSGGSHDRAIAYARAVLESPDRREVVYAMGSDDGCRVWLNGELVRTDNTRHGLDPYRFVGKMSLRAGPNDLLVKVENGTGGFGLAFRIFDPEVGLGSED